MKLFPDGIDATGTSFHAYHLAETAGLARAEQDRSTVPSRNDVEQRQHFLGDIVRAALVPTHFEYR